MEKRGDVIIQCLCESHTYTIIDVIFGYYDANTYKYDPMDKLLASWKKENKDKHGKNCHEQCRIFSSFLISVDGML